MRSFCLTSKKSTLHTSGSRGFAYNALMDLTAKAILFDIDGTLVDSTASVEADWTTWSEHYHIPPQAILANSHGRRSEDIIADHIAPELRSEALRHLLSLALKSVSKTRALPGAKDILDALSPTEWAVVTSGERDIMAARLSSAGLPIPEVFVAAEDVEKGKPDPEGFLKAAALLGVSSKDCVVIEDSPSGVDSGKRAHTTVIAVATSHPTDALKHADIRVRDLEELVVKRFGGHLHVSLSA